MAHTQATRRLTVREPHTRTYQNPISVMRGERVTVGDRDTQGDPPGTWVWCTNSSGTSGWIPEQFLDIVEQSAVVLVDCDSIELTVDSGDQVRGSAVVNGWVWCETDDDAGWVPAASLRDQNRDTDPEPGDAPPSVT